MGVRKNYRNLTDPERDRFVQALFHVKSTGLVDQFAEIHTRHFFHIIHRSSHFLPWHREMLLRFERELQKFHPDVTIPYWDSTVDRSPSDPLWANSFLGQFNSAWRLGRALGSATLPTPQQVQTNQGQVTYDAFWPGLERPIHDRPHVWVGGVMGGAASPGDPVFYLHHCWIDLLWARWQLAHPGAPFVSSRADAGLNDPLTEWPDRTPADVLDHHALGYTYDIERYLHVDRSAQFGTPPAAGAPTACVIPGLGVHNIAYRDTSGRLHELWRGAEGATGTTNLTANAGAPTAAGNPFAYVDTSRNTEILLFRGGDGTVRSLYWSTGPVGHDNLSGTAGAPRAAGDPVGYYVRAADAHHVIYRTSDGHLHELNWTGVAPVVYGGNLTGAIGAPRAAGDSTAFVNAAGVNIVVYRGTNSRILSLYWADGPSGLDDLSALPARRRPRATRSPTTRLTTTPTRSSIAPVTDTCTSSTGQKRRSGCRLGSHGALGRPCGGRQPRRLLQRRHEHQARHLPLRRRPAARDLVDAGGRDTGARRPYRVRRGASGRGPAGGVHGRGTQLATRCVPRDRRPHPRDPLDL